MNFCYMLLFVGLFGNNSPSDSSRRVSADTLIGLWGTEQIIAPMVRGILTIDERSTDWRAMIGGFTVAVKHVEDTVAFTLPGEAGEFRGRRSGGVLRKS